MRFSSPKWTNAPVIVADALVAIFVNPPLERSDEAFECVHGLGGPGTVCGRF